MMKHVKQALAQAQALGVDCYIKNSRKGGHLKLMATCCGVSLSVPVSSSPKDENACVNMCIQMLKRRFLERGVQLPREL